MLRASKLIHEKPAWSQKPFKFPEVSAFVSLDMTAGSHPTSFRSLLVFFNCEKRALRSKCFLPKRRNVTPRRGTAHAKGLRVLFSFSRKYPRFFARFRSSGKKGEPRDFMLREHLYFRARHRSHLHALCM